MPTNKNDIVINYILDNIKNKIYLPGQMIESETELSNKLNISRMTIRKALDTLGNDGIIYKEKGRGTFISKRPKYAEFMCGVGFSEEARKRGMTPSTKNATIELIKANEELAQLLNVELNDKLWKVNRVRCFNNIPVVYECEYFIYKQCPDLTISIVTTSIFQHLEKKGISFAYADQKLEAIPCPKKIAKSLEIKQDYPVIKMTLTSYTKNGMAFNYGQEYYRTDKFTLVQSIYKK